LIFVTVGTHEQQFDRLIKEVDKLVEEKVIQEEVFIQTGYCTYKPVNCKYKDVIGFEEMDKLAKEARIIITHGGPGSIFLALENNIIPIVVPRDPQFDEHVDEHQIKFTQVMANNEKIIMVRNIDDLKDKILNYQEYCKRLKISEGSNLNKFIEGLDRICDELLAKK
jgi:UDP-N-acetylglucosamine transferase subunit ALG13